MAAHLDLTTRIGGVVLPNPVMTASGTAGHGAELAPYVDLGGLGAVVVKSLSAEPWAGNPAPRVTETSGGMLNSVGLQNPGVEAWLESELPELLATGARVVASIWGFTVDAYEKAAAMLAEAPSQVIAVEVNLSCPNIESRRAMFAHSAAATAEAVEATAAAKRPRWAKLSPNVTDITEIAVAALDAGAEAVTLINTIMGLAIDPETRRPRLGNGGGGLSGAAIHPVAVRAVNDVYQARPGAAIVGVGGVTTAEDAVELLLAGASAIQVGTATFRDPRAAGRIVKDLGAWCRRHGVRRLADLIGAVQ
ncbi:MAG: dihydroorotate dehydrogenase catalytic subunit [Actinomycetota bacterium]|jgi:dihydroorotate dehydrogenase (NAD+) catalytic subunit|nr:dihydroorotate dehydrogenase catalytic subunit [Actinomycetota bacterium]